MKILFYVLLTLSFSCINKNTSIKEINTFKIETNSIRDTFNINTLFKNEDIISPLSITGGFSYHHSKSKNEVKVISSKKINNITIQFVIIYNDPLSLYKKANFYPGDAELSIKEVYFNVNGIKTLINNSNSINASNIWFSETKDKSIKIFEIGKTAYVLIHGINLYCNGRHCNDDTIYAIRIASNGNVLVKGFQYNRIYPYLFDKVELVNSRKPFIYLPKIDIEEITKLTDFDKQYLD